MGCARPLKVRAPSGCQFRPSTLSPVAARKARETTSDSPTAFVSCSSRAAMLTVVAENRELEPRLVADRPAERLAGVQADAELDRPVAPRRLRIARPLAWRTSEQGVGAAQRAPRETGVERGLPWSAPPAPNLTKPTAPATDGEPHASAAPNPQKRPSFRSRSMLFAPPPLADDLGLRLAWITRRRWRVRGHCAPLRD
jgi:hypothetical protein